MKDLKFYHKKELMVLSKTGEGWLETIGWKFTYKGCQYGHVGYATQGKPISDDKVITSVELLLEQMKKAKREDNGKI